MASDLRLISAEISQPAVVLVQHEINFIYLSPHRPFLDRLFVWRCSRAAPMAPPVPRELQDAPEPEPFVWWSHIDAALIQAQVDAHFAPPQGVS